MKKSVLFVLGLALTSSVVLTSCKDDDKEDMTTTPAAPSLYTQVGGTTMVSDPNGGMIEAGRLALRSVVDSTIFVIAADSRLAEHFGPLLSEVGSGNTTNLSVLSENLTDFFAVALGSKNDTYVGLNMVDAHNPNQNARMGVVSTNAHFDAFVEDLVVGAQQNGVPNEIIGKIGAVVETLRGDVVQG